MERNPIKQQDIARIAGVAVGGIFIYAGILKVLDPAQFASDIDHYKILSWWPSIAASALYLPWLEITCGAALAFRRFRLGASCILITLSVLFLSALASAKIRGLDISCGCFGKSESQSLVKSMFIDMGILIVLLSIFATDLRTPTKSAKLSC